MAKILVISEDLWYPPVSGEKLRQHHLLRNLSREHEYVWCCRYRYTPTQDEKDEGMRFARSEGLFIPTPSIGVKMAKALPCLFCARPIRQAAHVFRKVSKRIRHLTATEPFDIVQIEHTKNAEYAKAIAPSCKAVRVLTVQNLAHVYYDRQAEREKSFLRRLYCKSESKKYRKFEEKSLKWFDAFISVSEENSVWLKEMGVKRAIHLSRNGINVEEIIFLPSCDKPNVMFLGGMDYPPNIDAVLSFSKEVLPLIWDKRPNVKFLVVGQNPVREIKALESEPRITVTGRVPDIASYYERAALTVVPLHVGGGTRLKIVESMAFGRVVISTTIGAEGLLYKDGKHLLIADNPKHMAHTVINILEDANLRSQIAISARKHVEAHYNCNRIAQDLSHFYHELLKERPSSKLAE